MDDFNEIWKDATKNYYKPCNRGILVLQNSEHSDERNPTFSFSGHRSLCVFTYNSQETRGAFLIVFKSEGTKRKHINFQDYVVRVIREIYYCFKNFKTLWTIVERWEAEFISSY